MFFSKTEPVEKAENDRFLINNLDKGCEYSFAILFM